MEELLKEDKMISNRFLVGLFVSLSLVLAGCALFEKGQQQWSGLTSVEQAVKADEVLLKTLDDLKDSIDQQHAAYKAVGNQEGIAFIKNDVAPLINAAENAIALYHSAVILWVESGVEPSDIEVKLQMAQKALDLIEQMLIDRKLKEYTMSDWIGPVDDTPVVDPGTIGI